MSARGITLECGTVVVLALDGTLAYVEDVQPTFAAVVALPEQPTDGKRVFTPGRVGAKKISPFSAVDRVVAVPDLSERNRNFIGNYEGLRKEHGPNFVHHTPEEIAAMTVIKAGPAKKRGLKSKCGECGQQPGHPNHPGKHEFVDVEPVTADTAPAKAPRQSRAEKRALAKAGQPTSKREVKRAERDAAKAAKVNPTYTLVSEDLTAAKAQPRGDKYNDGNRSHRVVKAIASLPNRTGTLEDVVAALCQDGGAIPANPPKIVRRTLNQLTKADFGACVTTTGDVPADETDSE